jgi:glutathione peroxidase
MRTAGKNQDVSALQGLESSAMFRLTMFLLVTATLLAMQGMAHGAQCPSILDQRFNRLQDGQPANLCQYTGKVVLVVNTASFCGFTHQYAGLEKLYADYRDSGLVVLGFPANDFANQEPGTNQEVAAFCRRTYGVAFPMFEKSHVVGSSANPLFKALAERTGEKPKWNFHKYLISRDGKEVISFGSSVAPGDTKLMAQIKRMLKSEARP